MSKNIETLLEKTPVVPLVQAEDPDTAVAVSRALFNGGMPVVEVVFRTEKALQCLAAVAEKVPEVVAGAGTVLTAEQATQALDHGAKFIVSPGLDDAVVATAKAAGVAIFPGTATATEVQHAWNLNLKVVKFFPANINGGVPALNAMASVFRDIRFMPTGGVSAKNLAEYLALPAVLACGGSWLTPADVVRAGDFARVTELAREAIAIAKEVRG